jgi:hypothetical protein
MPEQNPTAVLVLGGVAQYLERSPSMIRALMHVRREGTRQPTAPMDMEVGMEVGWEPFPLNGRNR